MPAPFAEQVQQFAGELTTLVAEVLALEVPRRSRWWTEWIAQP